MQRSAMRKLVIVGLAFASCACSITPWVKPYERQNLADKVMEAERDEVQGGYIAHVYAAREGQRGAEGGSGGGCGCN